MRVGIGFDVHRFDGRRPMRLGGVLIPSVRGLSGHSDADVLLHALSDALLGAIGAPDIGEQFPSDNPRYRDANSRTFLERAYAQVRRLGLTISNVDATVIADSPRLAAHKARIRRAISSLLHLDASRISIKAKMTETFCPGKDGIAAQAVVLLIPARRRRLQTAVERTRPGSHRATGKRRR